MQSGAGRLTNGIQVQHAGAPGKVRMHATAREMRRRHHGNFFARDINAVRETTFVDVGKPLAQGFHMPEHHGARGGYIQLMRFVHNIEPFLRAAFSFGNKAAHPVDQDLGAGAREAVHTRFFQRSKYLAVGRFFEFGDMCHFRGAEGVQLDGGEQLF